MTRDKAIGLFRSVGVPVNSVHPEIETPAFPGRAAEQLVDAFVALGMLKLDEPKSMRSMLEEVFDGYVSLTRTALLAKLDAAGLQITEKHAAE